MTIAIGRDEPYACKRATQRPTADPWFRLLLPEWEAIWASCARRFRSWRTPPRWSARDWWGEVQAQGLAAAWEALCAFDPGRGPERSAFVRGRVLARVLTRYRREWAYGRRCDPDPWDEGEAGWASESASSAPIPVEGPDILERLPEADRRLIERLFVDGWTQAQVARELGISQPAVSKRMRSILRALNRCSC